MQEAEHQFQSYTKREEKGQTVYVFGAGASASESPERVPTNADLLEAITDEGHLLVDITRRRTIQSFLRDLHYGVKYPPSFEEIFTMVDLSLSEERHFSGWPRESLLALRNDLLSSAGRVITGGLPRESRVHTSFVRNLFNGRKRNHRNTSFISFNYDITLDKVLVDFQDLAGDLDYGCYFRSFDITYTNPKANWDPPERGEELFLLKLHGSFNWLWCPACNFLRIHPNENVGLKAIESKVKCNRCKGPLEPLIIPPAWLKAYRNRNIANMWSIAEFLLAQAEHIVFVGYSLPDADFNFRLVLKRAVTFKRPEITVVSTHEEGVGNPTYLRYKRFFGRVNWRENGFKEFAKRPVHAME